MRLNRCIPLFVLVALYPLATFAWLLPASCTRRYFGNRGLINIQSSASGDFEPLMIMDIVLFSRNGGEQKELGAVQEDGSIAPLSAWTLEPAYDDIIEFVVDDELRFPGLTVPEVQVVKVLDENVIGYGSRQIGGGKGPKNPHGEESELLYYVDKKALKSVDLIINPDLEIKW